MGIKAREICVFRHQFPLEESNLNNKNQNRTLKISSRDANTNREIMMHSIVSTSWFGARTLVAALVVVLVVVQQAQSQATDAQGCRTECYPNTKMINGKGGVGKGENCRWILRTDGKAARLCDHIKCKKICPNNQGASAAAAQDQQSAASDNMRIEQQTEAESPNPATGNSNEQPQAMGIMRQMHGSKLAKAPVPGVAGGRLNSAAINQQQQPSASSGGRRMAPTLPPAVQYDENDTPPPISRFLDISPEE